MTGTPWASSTWPCHAVQAFLTRLWQAFRILKFNDNVELTAIWMRPFNDNYANAGTDWHDKANRSNYMENMDIFAMTLPLKIDGIETHLGSYTV